MISTEQDNIIRSVKSLLDLHFYIPKYQRGYRWDDLQVLDLLDDIDKFAQEGEESWYCLQPLVIKQNDKKQGLINVVDGQQRLTTIYLILHYLNERLKESQENSLFELDYQTRGSFIAAIEDYDLAMGNIDFLHIYFAYQTIKTWFDGKKRDSKFSINKFEDKLLFDCRFIWFDIDYSFLDEKPSEEEVFIRLNVGKIPLTNSELVKALFLNHSNFKHRADDGGVNKSKKHNSINEEEIKLKQLEISGKWDRMEEELHENNDALWYFINGAENNLNPRLEFILDLITDKRLNDPDNSNEYYTFRQYQKVLVADKELRAALVKQSWWSIESKFDTMKSWYMDKELYHQIGFLLYMRNTRKITCPGLEEILLKSKTTKSAFKEYLRDEIKKAINWDGTVAPAKSDYRTFRILLLHNLCTLTKFKNESARFIFKDFIKCKWDIEHINATASSIPENEKHKREWITESSDYVKDEPLKKRMEDFDDYENEDRFSELYIDVITYFSENGTIEDNDTISNLALLDAVTNRGYGNAVFPAKRKTILEKDTLGTFIPVCTRNVFNKKYSYDFIPNMTFWGENDKENYLQNLKTSIAQYLK